ncbi:hypothetical protein NGRA_1119 [Nosema granulosis]|uniref:Uncharacterized protein n=1 Tax=Nosema granulosis TaxID=83296 RepID=A0A9P6H036_9MICR|nr:hypothetical protein NGRA_1119 [Nosema granulosis]
MSLVKISLINIFNFVFIIYVLDSKNIEQLILYKIFSLFLLIKMIYTVHILANYNILSYSTKVFMGLYIMFVIFDIILARIAMNVLYYDFMRTLTHDIGFSLYRKKLYDIRQNLKVGLALYYVNLILEEYYLFLGRIHISYTTYYISYTIYRIIFLLSMFISCYKTSLLFRFLSIFIILSNLIVQIISLVIDYLSRSKSCCVCNFIYDLIINGCDNLSIILYILYYSIQHLIYTQHVFNLSNTPTEELR